MIVLPSFSRSVAVESTNESLTSAEAPSVGKRRGNGEKRETTGKLKNRGRAGDDGLAFSFPFLVSPARFRFPSPQLPRALIALSLFLTLPKDERDLCGGESEWVKMKFSR